MTTGADIFRRAGVDPDSDERARRAVKAFRAMQPNLTAYARILTKSKTVQVEAAATDNGSTDGSKIYMRPPIALGDNTPHERRFCDKRDGEKQLICLACRNREDVLVVIYHEIAHIAYDSFEETADEDKAKLVAEAVREHGGKYADRIADRIEKSPSWRKNSYIGMAGLISEFLPIIVNALEDARVNREMFKARKGTKVMFDAMVAKTFNEGVEQIDRATGKVVVIKWYDYPQNLQAIVGLFAKASGYDYSTWFRENVVEALNDTELTHLVNRLDTVRSAAGVYHLSFPVLARLRELGFCKLPEDPEEEPEPEPEPESEEGDSPECEPGDEGEPADGGEEGSSDGEDSEEGSSPGGETEASDSSDEEDDDSDESSDSVSAGDESSETTESEESDSDDSSASASSDPDDVEETGEDSGASAGSGGGESSSDDEGSGLEDDSDWDWGSPDESSEGKSPDLEEPEDGEPIDTGADRGLGGTKLIEPEEPPPPPMGTPEEVKAGLLKIGDHEEPPKSIEATYDDNAVDRAIIQGMYFETPSRNIYGVREHKYGQPIIINGHNLSQAWDHNLYRRVGYGGRELGIEGDFTVPESVLGPALLRMRVAFADNERGKDMRNLKSGRVNSRVLGKRAFHDDDRLFKKKIRPGKKDYFVLIGMDVSGSTLGYNIALEKRAVMAQAELCARMGVKFAIFAHSGNLHDPYGSRANGLDMDIYLVKEEREPWDDSIRERLQNIGPDSANLDGHTLEYYRKICDRSNATNKIILYYTDGKMPAENEAEELEILQREIKVCQQKQYTLLGVGIRTDSPIRHGLDTVRVENDEDLIKVVRHLEKVLVRRY